MALLTTTAERCTLVGN